MSLLKKHKQTLRTFHKRKLFVSIYKMHILFKIKIKYLDKNYHVNMLMYAIT